MRDPDKLAQLVREWVEKAENDLVNAVHTLTLGDKCPSDTVCFHAQQCVEKYLKAFLDDVRLVINQAVDYFNLHVNVADHPITGGILDTAQALIAVNRAMLEEFGMDEWPAFDLRLQDIVGNVAQALYEAGQGTVSEIGQRAGWQPGRANKPVLRRAAPAEEAPPLRKIEEEPMDKESSLPAPLALTAVEAAFLDWSGDQPAAVFIEEGPEPAQPLAASFASAIIVCGARPGCKKRDEKNGEW